MKITKKQALQWSGLAALVLAARELYLWAGPERSHEAELYQAALNRAIALERPLVVLGGPADSLVRRILPATWGWGDMCIGTDGTPCRAPCPNTGSGTPACQTAALSPTVYLDQQPENSVVIYDASGLENSTAPDVLATAMWRAAGGADNIFVPQISTGSAWTQRLTALLQASKANREAMERFNRRGVTTIAPSLETPDDASVGYLS